MGRRDAEDFRSGVYHFIQLGYHLLYSARVWDLALER